MSEIRGSEIRGSEIRGSKIRGSKIRVSEIRGSEIRGSEIRGSEITVSKIRVSKIRISSNHRELHGAIFVMCSAVQFGARCIKGTDADRCDSIHPLHCEVPLRASPH